MSYRACGAVLVPLYTRHVVILKLDRVFKECICEGQVFVDLAKIYEFLDAFVCCI